MPAVHNRKSRAKRLCEGEVDGRARNLETCSRFVPVLALAGLVVAGALAGSRSEFSLRLELSTVICSEWSVSRESAAAAKRPQDAYAKDSVCGEPR